MLTPPPSARELCTDVLKGYLPTSDITQDTFASYHKVLKHSEPDLLIKFGTVNSLAGYGVSASPFSIQWNLRPPFLV